MSEFDWSERFPDMRPVRSAPALVRVNGIGCGVYGSRDHDEETGTYVTTYCFSFLFLPIFALTAYRVARAPNGGWYFLGRVPLSTFAKTWNVLLLLAAAGIAGLIGWESYTHSTDYVAGQRLAEADALAAGGQMAKAATIYRDVATGRSSHAAQASERLKGLLDDPSLNASLKDATPVFRAAVQVQQQNAMRVNDLEERGLKLIDQHGDKEPRDALILLNVLLPIAKDPPKLAARRQKLLERSVALNPNDVAAVSELAVFYEANNQLPRCEKILLPIKDRLGDSEGARILGQMLARKDKVEDACALLEPYSEKRLEHLRGAEQVFHNATQQLIESIRNGSAVGFPYQEFRTADDAKKKSLYFDYLSQQLKTDPSLKQKNEAYQQARIVVPATLDLGILLLRRAQTRPDPAAREADLKKAETMFLALQNDEAAESSAYRISLGQVYYWLGKHTEGRKKFDEVLAAEKRNPPILVDIARRLCEVGERSQACTLLEEAYNKESDKEKKFGTALTRSMWAAELDDKITWLQRGDPNNSQVKASLSEAKAEKAIEEGKIADAEPHLRQAIDLYEQMPENEGILNNCALAYMTLYRVTGDRRSLEKAETKLEKAVALAPRNSILLENAADLLLDAAVRDVIGAAIDLTALKKAGDHSLLAFLYDDRDGERRLTERYRTHPATVKATTFLERLLILAPKNPGVYRQLASLYEDGRNLDKLRDLAARLERGTLDFAAEETRTRELHAGKRDEKYRKDLQAQLRRYKERVETAGKGQRGVTYAVAATDLAGLQIGLATFGANVDRDEVVKLAESAYEAAPSSATRRHLEGALLFRAAGNLARKDANFAALAARTRRSLAPYLLIALVLQRDEKSRSLVLADADVKRASELIRETCRKDADRSNAWAWAMLSYDRPEAEKLAKALREDMLDDLIRTLNLKLYPFNADRALRGAWALRATGKDKEAAAVLQQCTVRGVPLP
ncbi:MAG TPA: hypothetical protein VE999_11515 [Gemmataceae bacterium]|nr:hypothetical protein [Gemmataceae bacterium]